MYQANALNYSFLNDSCTKDPFSLIDPLEISSGASLIGIEDGVLGAEATGFIEEGVLGWELPSVLESVILDDDVMVGNSGIPSSIGWNCCLTALANAPANILCDIIEGVRLLLSSWPIWAESWWSLAELAEAATEN